VVETGFFASRNPAVQYFVTNNIVALCIIAEWL